MPTTALPVTHLLPRGGTRKWPRCCSRGAVTGIEAMSARNVPTAVPAHSRCCLRVKGQHTSTSPEARTRWCEPARLSPEDTHRGWSCTGRAGQQALCGVLLSRPCAAGHSPHLCREVQGGFGLDASRVAPVAPLGHCKQPHVFLLLEFTRQKGMSWAGGHCTCRPLRS